jgi:DNA mismatch endonuclease (patch repair protein)
MTDSISGERRSANMRAVRAKDTKPELIVRRLAHGMGYRYRLHDRSLPGTPDLVFRSRRSVIFVHGCFWHRHKGCERASEPRSNVGFWRPKLARNAARDKKQIRALGKRGWRTLVIWECETKEERPLVSRLRRFLGR